MNVIRSIVDSAVTEAVAAHPKYFTPQGREKAAPMLVRKIMAAFNGPGEEPAERPSSKTSFFYADPKSPEARGYVNLRRIAGALPPRYASNGSVIVMASAFCPAVFALADLRSSETWPFLTDANKVQAWIDFFHKTLLDTARRQIIQTRNGVKGICMPGYWPPSAEGKMYDTAESA